MRKSFLIAALVISAACTASAQHSLQLDDGSGHYSTISASSSGGTYTLPSGGGTLLTSASVSSVAWTLGGNTGVGANNQIGTLDNTNLVFVTGSGGPNNRMQITSAGVVGVGSSQQFKINNSGNITKINNVTTSFPASQGSANTVLTNDGSGNLTWQMNGSTITPSVDNTYNGAGALAGNTDNLSVNANSTYFRVSNGTGGSINLTGISNSGIPNGHLIIVLNIGAQPIVLKNLSTNSTLGNRFDIPGGDILLGTGGAATFVYDNSGSGEWKEITTN